MIPKSLRDQVGLAPGEVEVSADGAALRGEPVASDELVERDGLLFVPSSGVSLTEETVRALRDADQR